MDSESGFGMVETVDGKFGNYPRGIGRTVLVLRPGQSYSDLYIPLFRNRYAEFLGFGRTQCVTEGETQATRLSAWASVATAHGTTLIVRMSIDGSQNVQ
jgi:hypothetical protein